MKFSKFFESEETAIPAALAAIKWMTEWRDKHEGYLPSEIFNQLIRLRPGTSSEVIIYKIVDNEPMFWLTRRNVPGDDPFNYMWHYTGGIGLYQEYELKTISRVAEKEIGANLTSCKYLKAIHPLFSARADLLCLLFLCTIDGEPKLIKETGRWFDKNEIVKLVPMVKNGIVPSHLVGLHLALDNFGNKISSPYMHKSNRGFTTENQIGYKQEILVVDEISAEMINQF